MTAIKLSVVDGKVAISYEEKTSKNIDKRLKQLKESLGVTWYGVAEVMGLKPTEASAKLLGRWGRDPSKSSFQEMPESQWKVLLMLTEGKRASKDNG